jgi:hypothetical protein
MDAEGVTQRGYGDDVDNGVVVLPVRLWLSTRHKNKSTTPTGIPFSTSHNMFEPGNAFLIVYGPSFSNTKT